MDVGAMIEEHLENNGYRVARVGIEKKGEAWLLIFNNKWHKGEVGIFYTTGEVLCSVAHALARGPVAPGTSAGVAINLYHPDSIPMMMKMIEKCTKRPFAQKVGECADCVRTLVSESEAFCEVSEL